VVVEGLLDPPHGGRDDALVDRQRLTQVHGGLAGVGVVQVCLAESLQGACLLWAAPMPRSMASAWV
jgi:hypothetical protein